MIVERHEFSSDNVAPICPEAWTALEEANTHYAPSYGEDEWTADEVAHLRGPFILAVRGRIMRIRFLQSCPCLGTNRRRVIACKLVMNRVGAHPASITRVFPPD